MIPLCFASKNWGAPAIFGKQIEIKLLHSASTLESRIQVYVKSLTKLVENIM
ncbi:MAG: hypothetical protein P8X89_06250 [Reinekea sp.]